MESSTSQSRKAIALFLLITFALSSIFYLLIIQAGFGRLYGYGIMWCPGLAAFATLRLMGRKITALAWQWGKPMYQLWSYLIPLIYSFISYAVIWLTGWGKFFNAAYVNQTAKSLGWQHLPPGVSILLLFILTGIYGLPGSMATALGEEIGWRGFLVPELSKLTSYTKTSFISGIIWAVWHYPILIFGPYNNGTPVWYGLTCFTIMVISISFVFTWFRFKSASLWTGVLLHASHNLFIQGFFTPITQDAGSTKYFTDEFGAVLPVVCLLVALYFWRRRSELSPLKEDTLESGPLVVAD